MPSRFVLSSILAAVATSLLALTVSAEEAERELRELGEFVEHGEQGVVIPLEEDAREALASLGDGVVGRALPARRLERPDAFLREISGEYEFAFTEGTDHGRKRASERVTREGRRGERVSLTRNLGIDISEEAVVDPDGSIRIVAEADGEYGYRIKLDPGLVFRAGLEPGETWEVVNTLRVYAPDAPDEVAYTGTMKSVLRYGGRHEVTTPAGRFDAVLISEHRTIDVGPVDVIDERYDLLTEGVGKVATVEGVRLSALFVIHMSDRTSKVLVRVPGATPEVTP